MYFNKTCNTTLEMMMISEVPITGTWDFHHLGLVISGASAAFAIALSLYLILMHAMHYTKPYEQRHIIRILFMVPIYATASFLGFYFYYHAIYYTVISDCYEAFTIASFFALLCNYIAPNLHDQKVYFRGIQPRPWVWPLSWLRKCCGGERGPWRTPRSGLTWFNIIWAGIYQYCFVRVAMTVTAVLTQYFGVYCESSNSPVFAHIWVLAIECVAVFIAMYCVIQFYIQLRHDLAPHRPLIKVTAIKLVIFLSFWQTFIISILTSTFDIVHSTPYLAYPDIKVGIPACLLCVEMAVFSIMHVFAYPWKPYRAGGQAVVTKYPTGAMHDPNADPGYNEIGPNQGGPLGLAALLDAMNPWDLIKAFGRAVKWLFVGFRRRELDPSYELHAARNKLDDDGLGGDTAYRGQAHLPIAEQFRRSKLGLPPFDEDKPSNRSGPSRDAYLADSGAGRGRGAGYGGQTDGSDGDDARAALISHAQPLQYQQPQHAQQRGGLAPSPAFSQGSTSTAFYSTAGGRPGTMVGDSISPTKAYLHQDQGHGVDYSHPSYYPPPGAPPYQPEKQYPPAIATRPGYEQRVSDIHPALRDERLAQQHQHHQQQYQQPGQGPEQPYYDASQIGMAHPYPVSPTSPTGAAPGEPFYSGAVPSGRGRIERPPDSPHSLAASRMLWSGSGSGAGTGSDVRSFHSGSASVGTSGVGRMASEERLGRF